MYNEDPNYKRIYEDIIALRHPEKRTACEKILSKKKLISLDVLALNVIIFGHGESNQKYKSYDKESIFKMLQYQKEKKMNNKEAALHFNLSRNTISKWKRIKFKL
ncbi:helix-turn-helix domain-containing protein [Chryseobacterium sp. G0162]|uniref:helix-turn-helix domain-containing protein n=1 Tax=Chryseobacterium sp. G0162 TaxID=2487063 RepID=UPI000F5033D4|nr:helix-turn-helix domain-containing protein [Chryseobacterium sp. G0162]AZB07636.1 helix-turn-helix domain-containing protein [Chryseobacterium sp. G0162]